jgi:hypothetical protein
MRSVTPIVNNVPGSNLYTNTVNFPGEKICVQISDTLMDKLRDDGIQNI